MSDPNNSLLREEVIRLKEEKGAVILAHYYVPEEVRELADLVGDSFEMAKRAKSASEKLIVICGVYFMGESAKILAPDKKVLLPVPEAGCPMADMITPEQVLEYRREHPNAAVVCYVNSPASVKAVSDICCTSSSAEKVVGSLSEDEVIFVPDKNLGAYTAGKCPDKRFFPHNGYCPVHNSVTEADILAAKREHPEAALAAHPECREEVLRHADYIGSTTGIIDYARTSGVKELIVGTESEITTILRKELPGVGIYPATQGFVCQDMKKLTLAALRDCLKYEQHEVTLSDEELAAAKRSLDRMVSI